MYFIMGIPYLHWHLDSEYPSSFQIGCVFFSRDFPTRQPRQQESKCCHEPVHGSEKNQKTSLSPKVRQGVGNSGQIQLMDRILHQFQFDLKYIRINHSDVCLPTLLGTNLSPEKPILKIIFLFPRCDMLVRWRVFVFDHYQPLWEKDQLQIFRWPTTPSSALQNGGELWIYWKTCNLKVGWYSAHSWLVHRPPPPQK